MVWVMVGHLRSASCPGAESGLAAIISSRASGSVSAALTERLRGPSGQISVQYWRTLRGENARDTTAGTVRAASGWRRRLSALAPRAVVAGLPRPECRHRPPSREAGRVAVA